MKKTNAIRRLWYRLSPKQRFVVRRLYYLPIDFFDKITGKTNMYVPPRGKIYTGSPESVKDFINHGRHQLRLLKARIKLKPNDIVLDIGSGVGRTAIALSEYLNTDGAYEGFDVVKQGVDWCNKGLGKDFKNFNFTYVPLFNDLYNRSRLKASEFVFPYKDGQFDKIFSFSLFTHMSVKEIQHYFHEISRVMKGSGLGFSTFFLYNDKTENELVSQKGFSFPYKRDGYRLMNNKVKSGNIAIHESTLQNMLEKANLERVDIIYGYWKNTANYSINIDYQDIVVFKKKHN